MEWLEIIKVRTAGVGERGVDKELLEQVEKGLKSPGLAGVKVFAHASVPNDLVITLKWGTEHPQPWGSDLAHSLIQELKRYGLTDHSVWIEKFPKE
ncbi:MAG: hypothetical protein B6245_00535 [Desulfobacteraceae bacterium 4572_88]|nr:MAG: hypothetical protein B6245_00535 [Desulfobacteraceae bacterium 4572_88]